jgi:hypothetical protein
MQVARLDKKKFTTEELANSPGEVWGRAMLLWTKLIRT